MKARGFTLVELIVAVAIFVVLGALAYGGYNTAARQAALARESMARLKAVQTTMRLLAQDFHQAVPRPVRDVLGDGLLAAVHADARSEVLVSLTRSGWTNPAGLPRSTFQRVRYVLEDGTLRREHWTVLDATLASPLVQRELLAQVESVTLRYLAENRQWQPQWPPAGMSPAVAARSRPLAVEITLELEDYGQIVRIIEVGG